MAELKKQNAQKEGVFTKQEKSTCSCAGNEGACKCPAGTCACAGCTKAGPKEDTPQVGTDQAGSASRQFGAAKDDIVNTAKDIMQS